MYGLAKGILIPQPKADALILLQVTIVDRRILGDMIISQAAFPNGCSTGAYSSKVDRFMHPSLAYSLASALAHESGKEALILIGQNSTLRRAAR
jgi:hypothetical protein